LCDCGFLVSQAVNCRTDKKSAQLIKGGALTHSHTMSPELRVLRFRFGVLSSGSAAWAGPPYVFPWHITVATHAPLLPQPHIPFLTFIFPPSRTHAHWRTDSAYGITIISRNQCTVVATLLDIPHRPPAVY